MKNVLLTFLSIFILTMAPGRDRNQEKLDLKKLVEERETRFGEYARAAASRSGIFGNKTKKDLKGQVEVLTEIIKTDNRIISLLNNFLDYRTFQRTTQTYSQAELEEKNQRLDVLTTSLSKNLKAKELEIKKLQISIKWARLWNYLLLAVVMVMGYLWWRERKKVMHS